MTHAYDFYKPKLDSEYPEVDGPLSITSYISAVDASYAAFRQKHAKAKKVASLNGNGEASPAAFSLDDVDYPVFHSPYGKMVQKAHARLVWNDFMENPEHPKYASVPNREAILAQPYKESLLDKNLEKTFMAVAKPAFESSVELGMKCARRCGNMYTASLYGGLASLVSSVEPSEFLGKRISLFAYGSGIASSFFTIRVKGDTSEIKKNLDLVNRLAAMKVVPCQEYVDSLKVSSGISLPCGTIADPHYSFVRSTTSPSPGSPPARSTTSGPAGTTSRPSTASSAASTAARPRHRRARPRLSSFALLYTTICFHAILPCSWCSLQGKLSDYVVIILIDALVCTFSIYIRSNPKQKQCCACS